MDLLQHKCPDSQSQFNSKSPVNTVNWNDSLLLIWSHTHTQRFQQCFASRWMQSSMGYSKQRTGNLMGLYYADIKMSWHPSANETLTCKDRYKLINTVVQFVESITSHEYLHYNQICSPSLFRSSKLPSTYQNCATWVCQRNSAKLYFCDIRGHQLVMLCFHPNVSSSSSGRFSFP